VEILGHPFGYEVENVIRLFYPGAKLTLVQESSGMAPVITTEMSAPEGGGKIRLSVSARGEGFAGSAAAFREAGLPVDEYENALCMALFGLLRDQTGKNPPWGMLTGVRPVRLAHPLLESGRSDDEIIRYFSRRFAVTEQKSRLAIDTARAEQAILAANSPRDASLYVGIPFCPTRCLYCSFVSHAMDKARKLLPEYVRLLCREIHEAGILARECGLRLQTVYVGGGTPTTLSAAELEAVLQAVAESFCLSDLLEYTVEAGRPDTLVAEDGAAKLAIIRRHAGRISINPQTMNDAILAGIGRGHTAAQTLESYQMARAAGFSAINMDLIAGLPGETPEGFLEGLRQVIGLSPENITVHTLTVKRSSELRGRGNAYDAPAYDLSALLDTTRKMLAESAYAPYYLYRQKGTLQNLENVGYSRIGKESRYNVYIMEEVHTVLAVGAGAVTKLYLPPDRLKRVFNFKYPYEYISRFDEIIARKAEVRKWFHEDYSG
jgi:oxygen-independent coproporphyrinogen-3 oxidase